MGIFDRAARYATQQESIAVLGRVAQLAGVNLRFLEWIDTRTTPGPEERDQTADRVALLVDEARPDCPWLALLEFKAQHDPDKLDDTLAEVAQLRRNMRHGEDRKGKYNILAVLIYLTGRCPEDVLDMTVAGGRGTRHAPVVWNVAGDDAAATLDAFERGETTWGILYFVPLMQGADEHSLIRRWRDLVVLMPKGRTRSGLVGVALVFAELAACRPVWQRELEDAMMTESAVVNEWIEKATHEKELQTRREDLIFALQTRFPGAAPAEVIQTVNSQPSLPLLRDWFQHGLTEPTIDDFIAVLRR